VGVLGGSILMFVFGREVLVSWNDHQEGAMEAVGILGLGAFNLFFWNHIRGKVARLSDAVPINKEEGKEGRCETRQQDRVLLCK